MSKADTQSNERKWRNKSTGTVYASVEHNGTVIATVTTDAGSTYNVHWDKLEEVPSPTQSDKTVEQFINYWYLSEEVTDSPALKKSGKAEMRRQLEAILTAREERMVAESVKAAVLPIAEAAMTIEPTDSHEVVLEKYSAIVKAIRKQTKDMVAQLNPQEPQR